MNKSKIPHSIVCTFHMATKYDMEILVLVDRTQTHPFLVLLDLVHYLNDNILHEWKNFHFEGNGISKKILTRFSYRKNWFDGPTHWFYRVHSKSHVQKSFCFPQSTMELRLFQFPVSTENFRKSQIFPDNSVSSHFYWLEWHRLPLHNHN